MNTSLLCSLFVRVFILMKAIEQFFFYGAVYHYSVIMFESVDEILKCGHSIESY